MAVTPVVSDISVLLFTAQAMLDQARQLLLYSLPPFSKGLKEKDALPEYFHVKPKFIFLDSSLLMLD